MNDIIGKATEDMKETEEKQLLKLLENGKPYVKKHDGYAVKMDEDKQIEYKDWEDNERTLKVPAGSYIVVDSECQYPKIVTAKDFESKNKFIDSDKPKEKKDDYPTIGIGLMAENND